MAPFPPAVSPLLLAAGCCGVLLSLERLQTAALSRHRNAEVTFDETPAYYVQRHDTEEDQYSNLTATDFDSMMDPAAAPPLREPAEAECGDAREGSSCYQAVMWLLMGGFDRHPDWYPGYSTESSFHEVQSMLHSIGKGHCTVPCNFASQRQQAPGPTSVLPAPPGCHDTVEGEWCFQSLVWLKARGILLHPAWYPNLHTGSTIGEMQAELHRMGKSTCAEPCTLQDQSIQDEGTSSERRNASDQDVENSSERGTSESPAEPQEAPTQSEACGDAEPLSQCYLAVKYAMSEGIRTQPEVFPGLSPGATFKQVQENFHLRGRYVCAKPCPLPDTKKPVDQMSEEELARYLSGEWDGMVKAAAGPSPERAGEAPAEAVQSLSGGRLSEALQRNFGTAGGVTVEAAPEEVPGAPQKAGAASSESADPTIDPASRGAPGQDAEVPAVPSVGNDRRSAEAITTTQMAVSSEESAARLKQQVLKQLEQAENETEDPRVISVIASIKARDTKMSELIEDVKATAHAASKLTEVSRDATSKLASQQDPLQSGVLPNVDGDGREKTREHATAASSPTQAPSRFDQVWSTIARLSKQVLGKLDQAHSTTTQMVETEEEMTARLSKQVLGDSSQTQDTVTQKAETDDEKTARLSKQMFSELDQAQSTTSQKVETEDEMMARLRKSVLGELEAQKSRSPTSRAETLEEITDRLSKQVVSKFDAKQ